MITPFSSHRFARVGGTLGVLSLCVLTTACTKVPLLAPTGSSITLTASATVLPVNGTTQLIAQVLEAAGTPPQNGTLVTFTTTLGTVQPSQAETSGGRVIVTFNAGTASGTATITATSGGAGSTTTTSGSTTTATASNTVKIAIGSAAVGGVTVSASPATVSSSGGSSTITANVRDTNGNVLPGVPVSFTADNGSLSAAVVTTDPSGNAQTTLTTTKVSKVTATAGVASGSGNTASAAQTATVTVNVNAVPNIAVGAPSPASPSVGQSVTFALTYPTDTGATSSPIVNVKVDFGDGTAPTTFTGRPTSVSHVYTAVGSYSVRATATDSLGDTSTGTGSVNVSALASVTVGAPSPSSPSVGQAVTFPLTYAATGSSPIQRINVDWGDGSSNSYNGTPSSVSHTYNSGGTFAMRVTAFDSFGNSSVGGTSIVIGARPQPAVSITQTTQNPQAGTDITFTVTVTPASGSGTSIQDVVIDFGDNTTKDLGPSSGTITVHHVYNSPDTYTVVVTATDSNGGVGRAATTVFVQAAAPLGVTLTSSAATGTLTTVETFTATVTGLGNSVVTSYLWEWGNLDPAQETTSNQVTHTYPHGAISYTVRVTVTTSNGKQASNTTVITP